MKHLISYVRRYGLVFSSLMMIMFFWLIMPSGMGIIYGIIAGVALIVREFFFVQKSKKNYFRTAILGISISIGIILLTMYHLSIRSVERFAQETILSTQELCCKNNECPCELEGWKRTHPSPCLNEIEYSKYTFNYRVIYKIIGNKFMIAVRYHFDNFKVYKVEYDCDRNQHNVLEFRENNIYMTFGHFEKN